MLRRAAPSLLVVAMLAALAAWGVCTDWTLPKFSALFGGNETEAEPYCETHNVPEAECIECRPSLLPPGENFGWCKQHGVAQCLLEHPEAAQLKTPPAITTADIERAGRALALRPRAENNSRCGQHLRRVQFASAAAVERAGVDIAIVQRRPIVEAIEAHGEVVYDENHLAHLASRTTGTVWRVQKQVGDPVAKGELLALVDAAEVGRAKSELLQALGQMRLKQATLDRLQPLASDGSVPGRQFREAHAAQQEAHIRVHAAQQALVNLGLPVQAEDLAGLDADELTRRLTFLGLPAQLAAEWDPALTTSNLYPLRSPLDGVVIERHVVEGEVVDAGSALFAVADVSRLWLVLNVRQEDARYLSRGQTVLFREREGAGEQEIRGTLSWISTAADEQTRTVKVRANLPNDDGSLRANTFGAGRIVLREEPEAIVVPSEAVHWDGFCHVVFVRDKNFLQPDAPKFFHVRSVRPGVKQGEALEIIAGLWPGEVVAGKNSVVLEAQLLKSNLGASCCEAAGPKK